MAEAKIAELEGKLSNALNSAREWKVESITARCGLNKLQTTFKSNRKKLASVREELKDLRRSQRARTVRRLERDNARLSAIPKSSEIDPVTDSTTALRKEIFRLKGVVSRQAEIIAELEAANKRLCSTNATHSKARFGTRSEKNGKGKRGSTGKSDSRRVSLGMDGRPAHTLSAGPRPTIHLTKIPSAHAEAHPTCRTGAMNPSSSRSRSRHMFAKFCVAQRQLHSAVNRVFDLARRDLKGLAGSDRRAKALRSLIKHRAGLSVFVDYPKTPMDNNFTERALRGPVIGRKLSFGSDSQKGAAFSAMMYGVFETLRMNGIDIKKWLTAWLTACAKNGGRPPYDLTPWLPWSMDEERRRAFANPP